MYNPLHLPHQIFSFLSSVFHSLSPLLSLSLSSPLLQNFLYNFSTMRRNCNLELCLLPSSESLPFPGSDHHQNQHHPMMEESTGSSPQQNTQQQKQLTIFYNGRVCVCDATEFQARSIILLAKQEMEKRMVNCLSSHGPEPSSPSVIQSQLYSPTGTDLSMKRSLQQFLHKRKLRIQATSPY